LWFNCLHSFSLLFTYGVHKRIEIKTLKYSLFSNFLKISQLGYATQFFPLVFLFILLYFEKCCFFPIWKKENFSTFVIKKKLSFYWHITTTKKTPSLRNFLIDKFKKWFINMWYLWRRIELFKNRKIQNFWPVARIVRTCSRTEVGKSWVLSIWSTQMCTCHSRRE
jgi:hypothetical protein